LADGNKIKLSPAWTIGTAIGDVPVGTQLFGFTGTGVGGNLAADVGYTFGEPFSGFFGGVNQWYNTGTLAPATDAILYPGEALILRTGATPVNEIVLTGQVSTSNSRTVILGGAASQDTPIGYVSPVDEVVIDANIPAVAGDQLLIFDVTGTGLNQAATIIYAFGEPFPGFFGGVNQWYNAGTLAALTTEVIPAGQSFIYRTAAAAGDLPWGDEPGFVSGL
jgi:hypothetical protein